MKSKILIITGVTVIEVLVASFLFSLLAGVMFYIFTVSSRTWVTVREGVELKESAQVLMTRIERLLRASSVESVEIVKYPLTGDNEAISFLSVYDDDGMASYNDGLAQMNWQEYIIFYIEDDPSVSHPDYYRLCSRTVFLGDYLNDYSSDTLSNLTYPPTSSGSSHYPVDEYIRGVTIVPLEPYLSAPRYITRNITSLGFEMDEEKREVEISVKIGKPQNPKDPASNPGTEKIELSTKIILRNN